MNHINTKFDTKINTFIVAMPNTISLDMLKEWSKQLDEELVKIESQIPFSMIIDTGQHQFESVDCLKFLRDYLTDNKFLQNLKQGAFVAPRQYVEPHIKSDREAYFNDFSAAYNWVKELSENKLI